MATRKKKATKKRNSATPKGVERLKAKISKRLAEVRGDRSQRQFARDLGVFQQNVNRYENGTVPHADFLIQLALKEDVSIDWLLLGTGSQRRAA